MLSNDVKNAAITIAVNDVEALLRVSQCAQRLCHRAHVDYPHDGAAALACYRQAWRLRGEVDIAIMREGIPHG